MSRMSEISEQLRRKVFRGPTMEASHTRTLEWQAADEIDRLRAEIDRQNNRYSEMSAEADRLSKMVTAFRNQDEAIRAAFGGKRDGRPTIECIWEAFNAKWREEDALFEATLDMKTEELRAEVARLAAENEKISALRATCNCGGLETGNHFSDCPYALALETPRRAIEIIELRARVSELDEKADRLAAENEKLRAEVQKLESECTDLATDLSTQRQDNASLAEPWKVVNPLQAEVARLAAENEKLRTALQEAFEVYAGSDGFIPETASEGYQQQVIKQIINCINAGLAALQDKRDDPGEGKAASEGEHEAPKP